MTKRGIIVTALVVAAALISVVQARYVYFWRDSDGEIYQVPVDSTFDIPGNTLVTFTHMPADRWDIGAVFYACSTGADTVPTFTVRGYAGQDGLPTPGETLSDSLKIPDRYVELDSLKHGYYYPFNGAAFGMIEMRIWSADQDSTHNVRFGLYEHRER